MNTFPRLRQVSKRPVRLNLLVIVIGIQCAAVVLPIHILLVQLFARTSPKPSTRKYPCYAPQGLDTARTTASGHDGLKTSLVRPEILHTEQSRKSTSMSESSVEKSSGFFRQLDDRGRDSEEGYKQPGESKNADDDVAPGGLSGPGAPGIRGHNSDAKVPERPSHSSSSPGTAAWPYTRSTVLRRDPSYQHCTQEGQDTGGDPRNTNNSANTSDCDSEPQRVSTDRNREARPSRRLTEQFSFIKEAPWFQNLVTYLRHNLTRLVEERRNRSQRNRESSTSFSVRFESTFTKDKQNNF